jgi:hypothetical protein
MAVDEVVMQRHVAAGQSAELQARPARDLEARDSDN